MYKFNTDNAYLDKVDGNVVVILTETFVYYTFNALAGKVLEDIVAGAEITAIKEALYKSYDKAAVDTQMDRMLSELTSVGMISECEKTVPFSGELKVSETDATDKFELSIDHYDDVAEYFAADPIHEVDPEKGWPHQK